MKTETLDSLLLDRALGELTPEVNELLEAYLAHEPEYAARAARLRETTALARAATKPAAPPMRDTASAPVWRAPRGVSWRLSRTELVRLAACLALGLAVGWLANVNRPAVSVGDAPPTRVTTASSATIEKPPPSASAFWSVATLAGQEPSRPVVDRAPYRLRWESPTKLPHLEE